MTTKDKAKKALEEYDDSIYYHSSALAEDSFIDGYVQGSSMQQRVDNDHLREVTKIMDEKYKRLKELAMNMYHKAKYLRTDASGLHKAMEDFYRFINFEEKNYG